MAESCITCRFYGRGHNLGPCRRRAPVVSGEQWSQSRFPIVGPGDWCGEYEHQREKTAAGHRGFAAEVRRRLEGMFKAHCTCGAVVEDDWTYCPACGAQERKETK